MVETGEVFREVEKQHGRPYMLVGGRPWLALGTPVSHVPMSAARRPTRSKCQQTSNRGRPRQSRWPNLMLAQGAPDKGMRLLSSDAEVPKGMAATGEPASTTDEKPALGSVGLTDQVESCRSSLPSFRDESPGRPG